MKYESTRHIRVYAPGAMPIVFGRIGWQGRTVLWHMKLAADLLGRIETEPGDELADVARRLDLAPEVFRDGVTKLFEDDLVRWEHPDGKEAPRLLAMQGVSNCDGGSFRIVDYVASERAQRSHWLRTHESRERRRLAKAEAGRIRARRGASKLAYKPEKVTVAEARELGLITRSRAAEILGVSLATLRRCEGTVLRPLLTDLGEHVFREPDVYAALAKRLAVAAPVARGPRGPNAEVSGDPIWHARATRLAEHMAEGSFSTAEMVVLGRRCGLKENLVLETMATSEWAELAQKIDGKWRRAVSKKEGA